MELIQILLIIFAVFALSRAFLRFKDNNMSLYGLLFWGIVWIGVIVVGLSPFMVTSIAQKLGIATGMNFLVYGSIIILFYLVFRLYVGSENQNRTITKLVRQIAIKEADRKDRKKKE